MASESDPADLLAGLAAIVGERYLFTAPDDMAPYLRERRNYYRGAARAVVRPGSTAEVAAILALADRTRTPVVPQSGNTGLVGGQTPDESGREIVLTLERMDRIRAVDAAGGTLVAEAGAILERVHEAADEVGMLFPLSLGAQGSCRIGGNIATNAGGTAVLAYGNMRSLVYGLEVVLASGEVWNGLRGLIKDNSGYDLKQLFIGSEGTLGIVTAAVLKLFPKPRGRSVAIAGLASPRAALELFGRARDRAGHDLTGFEIMSRFCIDIVARHLPGARDPLASAHPWYVLVEIASGESEAEAQERMEAILAEAFEAEIVADAAIAGSLQQAADFWRLRHELSELQKMEGGSVKHDVSVPVAKVPELLERGIAAVEAAMPGIRPAPFGHIGDGNIHFNFSQPLGMDPDEFVARFPELHAVMHEIVADLGGSVAAEHGVGRYKRALLEEVKSPVELAMMRRLKQAFDPNGILSPGRVV